MFIFIYIVLFVVLFILFCFFYLPISPTLPFLLLLPPLSKLLSAMRLCRCSTARSLRVCFGVPGFGLLSIWLAFKSARGLPAHPGPCSKSESIFPSRNPAFFTFSHYHHPNPVPISLSTSLCLSWQDLLNQMMMPDDKLFWKTFAAISFGKLALS